jgi:DNA-3-methyladenine glycosylase I
MQDLTRTGGSVLIGRDDEVARVEAVLDHLETGVGEALVISGAAGIGKSALLLHGLRRAEATRIGVLSVVGVEADAELAFADRLTEDASIIRNRGKIQATVDNARAMISASPNLVALAKSYEITRKRSPRSVADLPKTTPQAEAFARQLKSQGYRFVGPTSVYAFMQNVGVVNDHVHGCFRAVDYRPEARRR